MAALALGPAPANLLAGAPPQSPPPDAPQVRGVTKHEGSHLHLNTHVQSLLIDEGGSGRATGVATTDGRSIMARKGVISNADLCSSPLQPAALATTPLTVAAPPHISPHLP